MTKKKKRIAPPVLTESEKKALRGRGHHLNAVVTVGKEDLTDSVIEAIDAALCTHELIKVKVLKSSSLDKDEAAKRMAERTGAALLQRIGRVAILYRPRPEEEEG